MRRTDKHEIAGALSLVLVSALVVITCSALGPRSPSRGRAAVPSALVAPGTSAGPELEVREATADRIREAPVASSALPQTSTQVPGTPSAQLGVAVSPEGNALPDLRKFYDVLLQLQSKKRADHVRVAWLGDSHTQADFWTQAFRSVLQTRFGRGGPGFVHVGWHEHQYRHARVKIEVEGAWLITPAKLHSTVKIADGVFGLGGVRLQPRGEGARALVTVDASTLPSKGRWDLAFRFADALSSVSVSVTGAPGVTVHASERNAPPVGQIRHLVIESPGPGGTFEVTGSGSPQLMGVVIESASEPGIVVDTLGLNGARVASALAFDEPTWVAELGRRSPELVVIAYGSNESSDIKIDAQRHIDQVTALLRRIRSTTAGDCLVLGPIDRAGQPYEDAVADLNDAQRRAAEVSGCAFWSGQVAMGGKGSMAKWQLERPPLAQGDLLHLWPRGYERIGSALARDILQAFDAYAARSAPPTPDSSTTRLP